MSGSHNITCKRWLCRRRRTRTHAAAAEFQTPRAPRTGDKRRVARALLGLPLPRGRRLRPRRNNRRAGGRRRREHAVGRVRQPPLGLERGQVLATTVFVSKSGPGVRMIDRWYALCSHDGGALLLDRESGSEQNVGYVEHRHDQSALSCVVKKLGGFTIPDETYFGPNWRRGAAFPIQARRNRTGIPYHI